MKRKSEQGSAVRIAQNYIEQFFADKLVLFTDGSKDPETELLFSFYNVQ